MKNQTIESQKKSIKKDEKPTDLTAVKIEEDSKKTDESQKDRTKYGDWQVNGRTIDF